MMHDYDEATEIQVHKVTMYVVDHDGLGPEELRVVLENTTFPNRCINPDVEEIRSQTIQYTDDHPVNSSAECKAEYARLFPEVVGLGDAAVVFTDKNTQLALPKSDSDDENVDNHVLLAAAVYDLVASLTPDEKQQVMELYAAKVEDSCLDIEPPSGGFDTIPPAGIDD